MPINSEHKQYKSRKKQWGVCRDFFEGEDRVKSQAKEYIPRPTGMSKDTDYAAYVARAFFFNGAELTKEGLSGVIVRKAPTIDLPERVQAIQHDIDYEGNGLRSFSKQCLDDQFAVGRFGILVDTDPSGRFFLRKYPAEDIINWKNDMSLLVLREIEEVEEDRYTIKEVTRYRELRINEDGVVEVTVHSDTASVEKATTRLTRAGRPLTQIPFFFCNVTHSKPSIEKPPMLDLVKKNVELLRVGADYANSLYFTGNPFLYVIGADQKEVDKIVLGSSKAVGIAATDARIGFCESHGHGVNPNKQRYEDIRLEMALMGTRLLEPSRAGVETAQAVLLKRTGEVSVLTKMIVAHNATMTAALHFLNWWMGGSLDDTLDFTLNMDFVDIVLDANTIVALNKLVASGLMSFDTLFYNLARGELIPEGRTAEDEKQAILDGTPFPLDMNEDADTGGAELSLDPEV